MRLFRGNYRIEICYLIFSRIEGDGRGALGMVALSSLRRSILHTLLIRNILSILSMALLFSSLLQNYLALTLQLFIRSPIIPFFSLSFSPQYSIFQMKRGRRGWKGRREGREQERGKGRGRGGVRGRE